jgi:predicted nucleic acid-binding protein
MKYALDSNIALKWVLYIALAEREACALATADDKPVKNLQPQFPVIVSLSSLP